MHTADSLVRLLGLTPHPEGGYFRETYRAPHDVPADALPTGYPGPRSLGTAIYYLITPDTFSAMHRVRGDEIFHFYLGDPVEMLELLPAGGPRVTRIGQDLAAGMVPQKVVAGGTWQGTRLAPGGSYALLGTTMAPGFSFDDFEVGDRARLTAEWPAAADRIRALTRA